MNSSQFLRSTLASCLASALILSSAQSYADDTEIFFSSADTNTEVIKPNVLFILDNSGSMNWGLSNNNNATGGAKSRLTVLKESFQDIMGNTSGINAGIMVLNERGEYGNGRFMYPVTDVDQAVPSGNTLSANTPGIKVSGDDATQANTIQGAVIDSPNLVMGQISVSSTVANTSTSTLTTNGIYLRKTVSSQEYACRMLSTGLTRNTGTPCNGEPTYSTFNLRNNAEVLFHFQSLSIPASATITNAYIAMTASNTQTTTSNPSLSVRIQDSKTPAALNDNNLIGTRSYLTTTAITTSGGWSNGNPIYINVTSQLSALRNVAPAGDPISSVLVRLNGAPNRDYQICAAGTCIPKLIVEYNTTASNNETRTAALRFQDVAIPAGATIESATISFVPAASSTGGNALFEVRAENAANANIFTAGSNLDTRPKSTAVEWIAPDWVAGPTPAPLTGPDVTSLVQGVVNNGSWCGNNAMAFYISPKAGNTSNRVAYSVDGAGGLQPVLNISYSGGSGCINSILELRVNAEKDDARQASNGTVTVAGSTLPLSRAMVAARFEQVRILKNASIMDAQLVLTPANTVTNPNLTTSISFEQADNSAGLVSEVNNLSGRSKTTGRSCIFNNANGGWTSGQAVSCSPSNLASDLQSVFARSGWAANNAISVFLTQSSDSTLNAVAYEQNPSQAIKLRLKIAWGGLADQGTVLVRDDMIASVNSMFAESGTPIVPTLYDAARYVRGDLSGRPTPIETSCQPTHVVLLTDGQANGNTTEAKNGIAAIAGSCANDATDDGEKCARKLATFLADNDQLSSIPGDQKVITHTVGFALDASGTTASANIKKFLKDVATNGGGSFNTAENAGELTKAFNKILGEVLATDTTFVSASAPVNTFNRQDNKDELYFSLFRPAATDRWLGNLKRYRMETSNGQAWIVDRDGSSAIDPNTGFFKSTARSWWTPSNIKDGSVVSEGGAASQIGTAASRNSLFTNVTNGSNALTLITDGNSALTKAKLGLDATNTDAERTKLINYIRGLDNGVERKAMGDPIHATPSLVTYRCNSFTAGICTDEEQSAILGTNEGFVQMFDTKTGGEQFAFMPEVLLPNIKRLAANDASTQHSSKSHPYGMDNTVTVWANDVNNNGAILASDNTAEAGEFVYAYATMGRGGRDIYALNITNRNSPTLLWKIQGGSGSFARLGQTWSAPVKTKIKIGGTDTDVLVFGGGYDPDQDNATVRTADDQGNDLYIVNARTGSLIWSASTAGISGMNYSIPSGVSVIGLQTDANGKPYVDPNGLAGQIFVGDMGGQVWRFHVNNGQSGPGLVTGGIFASVAGNDAAGARRFYHEPEIALAYVKNRLNLTVNIGSGYRGHPLNKVIEDRFYSFRSENLNSTGGVLTESQLYDATNLTTATEEQVQDLLAQNGWYIRLTRGGEKVLSRPLVADGKLFFNTYEPRVAQNACKAAAGTTRAYSVNLLNSTALSTTRDLDTKGSSLPSNPQLYCKGNSCWAYNDPSQLTDKNGLPPAEEEECANSLNPEKCRCDKNPICVWMPSTPRTFWTDERSN
ncbi:MAG: PilC/PilY family type IV pilus protein [Pseudomonas sp.]|uniref:pilus assembly protein n=1 Tax=Pseudomonas sp. TaxID=306 RepID=UPI002728B7D9|nr:PilC/PilY family type IV pilus protein [Pseudomonas sp.]MDO9617656.1 PilC/PilY family type IV pilus protein [Pseudomonas sp.]MDP2445822.1 PilC/PilY family type IV pilus protein [Pseudomonas sp.]MDZ4335384.1 PilC/PilY family type IV pilus protein [Pseudomonas sp.]